MVTEWRNRCDGFFALRGILFLRDHFRSFDVYDDSNVQHHAAAGNHRNAIASERYLQRFVQRICNSSRFGRNRNVHVCLGSFGWHRRNGERALRRNVHLHDQFSCGMFDHENILDHTTAGADRHHRFYSCNVRRQQRNSDSYCFRRHARLHVFVGTERRHRSNGIQPRCRQLHLYDYRRERMRDHQNDHGYIHRRYHGIDYCNEQRHLLRRQQRIGDGYSCRWFCSLHLRMVTERRNGCYRYQPRCWFLYGDCHRCERMYRDGIDNDHAASADHCNAIAGERDVQCRMQRQRFGGCFRRNGNVYVRVGTERRNGRYGFFIVCGNLHLHDQFSCGMLDHAKLHDHTTAGIDGHDFVHAAFL